MKFPFSPPLLVIPFRVLLEKIPPTKLMGSAQTRLFWIYENASHPLLHFPVACVMCVRVSPWVLNQQTARKDREVVLWWCTACVFLYKTPQRPKLFVYTVGRLVCIEYNAILRALSRPVDWSSNGDIHQLVTFHHTQREKQYYESYLLLLLLLLFESKFPISFFESSCAISSVLSKNNNVLDRFVFYTHSTAQHCSLTD